MNTVKHKPWKKALCVLLSVIIAFGTFVALTVGSSRLQDWLGIQSMLSTYASEIVDTKGAIAVDEKSMIEDSNIIELENKDGSNTVYMFSEPISYTDENGNLKTKDISVEKQSDKALKSNGYEYTNGQNDYRINFSSDSSKGLYIEFGESSYSIIPQSDKAVVGNESTSEILSEQFEDFEYPNIYGEGTNLKFYPQLNGVKDEIVLNSNIGQNVFSFKLTTSNCTAVLNDDGTVSLISNENKESVQTFAAPFAYDNEYVEGDRNEHYIDCSYTLDKIDDNTYIMSVNVDKSWLESESTVYPVTIDPTTGNLQGGMDLPIHSKRTTSGTQNDNNAVGVSTQYGTSRTLVYMGWPGEIFGGSKINNAYYYARELTGRTSGFGIEVYRLTSHWNNYQTWTTRPDWDPKRLDWVNVNGNSNAGTNYWYKFNITSVVQSHVNGTDNHGFMLKYDDEDGNANLRTFGQLEYSTSSMRPYVVINYSKDATAPTITSVTGNPTSWTNGNVTLTVNGAKDESGGTGLHSSPYSFSTSKNNYNWQSSNNKTFSSNCTIYISVRDAQGNIRLVSTQTIDKIDKIKPSTPVIDGTTENWSAKPVTLTASSDDDASGIKDYSFSTVSGSYYWQKENSKTFSDSATVYVCSRDNAGNISDPITIDVKIDSSSPSGSVNTDNKTDWVKQAVITADASDKLSGLHEKPYSFSTEKNQYNWQTENSKTVVSNGTYYIYARDAAENIVLLDTVTIDKIDRTAPVIQNIDMSDNGNKSVIEISAEDTDSGISAYSIDDGKTWQTSNVFEIEKDSENYLIVKVKDKCENFSRRYYDIYTPQVYYENGKIGIYNPNPKCECDIYYKLSSTSYYWNKYDKPFTVPDNQTKIYIGFYEKSRISASATPINVENINYFDYSENNIDLSLNYNGVSFNIARIYKNGTWHYTTDSKLNLINDNLIEILLPDSNSLAYVKQNKYLYLNESLKYKLAVIYDENDETVTEYILKCDKINYHYDINGKLVKISNISGDLFTLNYSENNIVIQDGVERQITVFYSDNHISSITDVSGGVINYTYENGNLIKVTDQANVIIGEYEYDGNVLIKSGHNNIFRDSNNRVSQIIADNGFTYTYEYNDRIVNILTSDEQIMSYRYDEHYRIKDISKNGSTISSIVYDENNQISYKGNESGGIIFYYYNDDGVLIRTEDESYSETDKTIISHYVYDENGNVILKAQFDSETAEYIPNEYDPDFNYDSVIEYEYLNGLPVKATDSKGNTTVKTYDIYGNVIKTTTTVTEDEKTTVSISESTYDISGKILSSKSDNNEIYYTYDAAGRTLLTNADGNYQRTVYDNYGRVIQEISNDNYKPEKDNLPNAYTDTSVGQRYFYDDNGSLVKDINDSDIETSYTYSEVGILYKKSFDIYDYYYQIDGVCDRIDVNGVTAVSYEYGITQQDGFELEEGETLNKVTYANGYTDYQLVKNNTVMAKYANNADGKYLNVAPTNTGYIIQDTGTNKGYSYSENNNIKTLKRTINLLATLYEYSVKKEEDKTTITENHFEKEFKTVVQENSVDYTTPTSAFSLTVNKDETSSGTNILKDGAPIITSQINYDEESNTVSKLYNNGLAFSVAYDDKGNIISDERNSYEYDKYGELIQTTGAINSSYTYDSRGNMLTKTVDSETTEFEYSNEWLDQLTSVNGVSLTYDINGNLLTYGDAEYTWSHGKQLDSITDGENSYSYTYDTNGVRASKTVNGRTTEFNVLGSKILAQDSIDGEMYFQYSGDELIGFHLDDVQYFYIKNPNGDIVGITDYDGNLIAEYEYDEWGKLLSITTAEEGNEEQLRIANANPFRYRGYYYDSETGYYYLQSRYYNPEWGRFISADDFNYVNNSKPINLNAYCYCADNPIMRSDPTGNKYISGSPVGDQVAQIIVEILQKGFETLHAAATELGKQVVAIITSIFIIDDALELSEDFAYYMAGILHNMGDSILNKSKLWYLSIKESFSQFIKTTLYNDLISINKNIFKEFYDYCVKTSATIFETIVNNNKIIIAYLTNPLQHIWLNIKNKKYVTILQETMNNIETSLRIKLNLDYYTVNFQQIFKSSNVFIQLSELSYYDYPLAFSKEPVLVGIGIPIFIIIAIVANLWPEGLVI